MQAAASTVPNPRARSRVLRWRLAVPPEKGGWVWWIGPFLVGLLNAPAPGWAAALVGLGACAAFCLQQPVTLLAKAARKAPAGRDAAPALIWALAYSAVLLAVAIILSIMGHGAVVALGLLAAPVFAWRVALVLRKRQRRQLGLDITGAAALALVGPAAYWAAGGAHPSAAFWILALPAAQSCASILHMFLRLQQRALGETPPLEHRLRTGLAPMSAHLAGVVLAAAAMQAGHANPAALAAMLIPAVEGAWSVLFPQVGHTPKRLGMRQLCVSAAAMALIAFGLRG